jgi:hypothetical protein
MRAARSALERIDLSRLLRDAVMLVPTRDRLTRSTFAT